MGLRDRAARDARWKICPFALGDTDSNADIHVAVMSQLSSLRKTSEFGRRQFADVVATDRIERIQVRRLDSIWREALDIIEDPRVYLKLDTQGWDLQVLAGAGERVADLVGIQTEASVQAIYEGAPTHIETLQTLERAGFTVSGMFPVTFDRELRLVECDCVAVR